MAKLCSVAPKLWVITSPRWCLITNCSALTICGKPAVPSVSLAGVSTSRILAFGATVCEYSTSSVVSSAQPMRVEVGLYGGTLPAGWMIFRDGGSGRPNPRSNRCRSRRIVGDPNGSTMTIVRPLPLIPRLYSFGSPYARWIWPGW